MTNQANTPGKGIKKLYVSETVLFAVTNIPEVDRTTLEKFLELVNASGTFGALSHEQILTKMRLTLRYIPNACPHSLQILAELLEIPVNPPFSSRPKSNLAHPSSLLGLPVNQGPRPSA